MAHTSTAAISIMRFWSIVITTAVTIAVTISIVTAYDHNYDIDRNRLLSRYRSRSRSWVRSTVTCYDRGYDHDPTRSGDLKSWLWSSSLLIMIAVKFQCHMIIWSWSQSLPNNHRITVMIAWWYDSGCDLVINRSCLPYWTPSMYVLDTIVISTWPITIRGILIDRSDTIWSNP